MSSRETGGAMQLGAKSRTVLVVAPVVAALAALATLGVARPEHIHPGPPLTSQLTAVGVVTICSAIVLLRAARRSRGPVRRAWLTASALAPLSALGVVGLLLDWPPILPWGVVRAGIVGVVVLALRRHTPRRPLRDWGLLLVDGWLVAGSVLLVAWGAVSWTGSPFESAPATYRAALLWLPVDLAAASVLTGMAIRSPQRRRTPVLLLVLAALLAVVADATWGLTGVPEFGTVVWMIMMLALSGATLLQPTQLISIPNGTPTVSPLLRLPQWAVVPGLLVALVAARDPVTLTVSVVIIVAMVVELGVAGRQNRLLWSTLRHQAEHLDLLLSESRDAIVHVDLRGFVRFASEALVDVLGFTPAEMVGRSGLSLVHPQDRYRVLSDMVRLEQSGVPGGRVSGRFRHADGSWRSVEATVTRRATGEPGYTLSARDVSDRVTLEAELRRLAGTDALTSLLNRPAFLGLLEQRVAAGPATVLFVDLDGFKGVNDTEGHAAGDLLLCEVAEILRRELRGPDVAARLGGDEFAVLLGTDQLPEIGAVADRLVHRLRRIPSDPARRTAASIGVALGGPGASAESLLGDADLAMYEAKARGGRRYVLFEPWMRERVTERARTISALESACAGEGLLLDVQPIVDMTDGSWVGFEALTRWQDGAQRRSPGEFLPIAEESGLIDPLGRWVLHRALTWLARWPDRAAGVSVNVAGSQLATPGFGDWVHQQLAGHGVAPARLTLEISERTALGDLPRATAVLQPLRALGVRIALDDFGTGFSSLGHLAELPVDELKIDRRFVNGLGRRAADDALVRAVCRLAADLGLALVAEGVETAAQEHLLLQLGCRLAQGYRYQEPTAVSELRIPATPSVIPSLPAPTPAAVPAPLATAPVVTDPSDGSTVRLRA